MPTAEQLQDNEWVESTFDYEPSSPPEMRGVHRIRDLVMATEARVRKGLVDATMVKVSQAKDVTQLRYALDDMADVLLDEVVIQYEMDNK